MILRIYPFLQPLNFFFVGGGVLKFKRFFLFFFSEKIRLEIFRKTNQKTKQIIVGF